MNKLLLFLVLSLLLFEQDLCAQKFEVCGSKIYDPSGQEFIVKGTNIGGPGWVWPEHTVDNFDHIEKWKFNTIRLNVKSGPSLDDQTSYSCGTPEYQYSTFGTLREIIKKYTDAEIVVLVDWHEVGGMYTGPALDCAKNWWTMVAEEYKENPYVWFDMYNEPNTTKTIWNSSFQTIIDAIRGTGNTNIIVATGNSWGQDANNWNCENVTNANSAVLTSTLNDPAGNLVYAIHAYDQWVQCQSKLNNYLDRVLAQGKSILIGEYGIHNNNSVQPVEDYVLASTRARKVGRIQWAFWGGDQNDLTNNGNGGAQNCEYDSDGNCTSLSSYGQKIWNDNRRSESLSNNPSDCEVVLAVSDSLTTTRLQVYPNPSMENISIVYKSETAQKIGLRLINGSGHSTVQSEVSAVKGINTFIINVTDIKPGFYIMQLTPYETKVLVNKKIIVGE